MNSKLTIVVFALAVALAGCGGDDDSAESESSGGVPVLGEVVGSVTGAKAHGQDSAAKSDLRNALVAAKVYFIDTADYSDIDAGAMAEIEPSLAYGSLAHASEDIVGIGDQSAGALVLAKRSKSGMYFCVADDITVGVTFGQADTLDSVDTVAECNAADWE